MSEGTFGAKNIGLTKFQDNSGTMNISLTKFESTFGSNNIGLILFLVSIKIWGRVVHGVKASTELGLLGALMTFSLS